MKLICYVTLISWFTIVINSQKFPQDQYPFPPQFKPPNSGVFGSDSSIYLPPESHTTIPYFSVNNGNKLPYQFLPPTVTKVPSVYPTPFPMIMSSTMTSRRNEDEEDDDDDDEISKNRNPQVPPPNFRMKNNQTSKHLEFAQGREMRFIPKTLDTSHQHPIDRIDIKYPPQFNLATQKSPGNQSPSPQRRMIISSEILKNEQGLDQVKRASLLSPQLISSPIAYYSTTEPAIPILRLSNEMDLDGSFSYEALGADQTHYVQHSRMENSGTDKEEQIVEGSYSYVGDNGQTYTVHYVADSNGYRASGDHLPVAPPIPEIIQRAVQYNLAEEAKKPQHQNSWQDNEKEYEHSESAKHRFSISPPRNLFTGRTPEAFSFGLSQSSVLQNNIVAGDNSQSHAKMNFDSTADQSKVKINNGPITPQITFLASQGAHNPSTNLGQQQISRIFATEKPTLPQLMNYEAGSSESDKDNNKALWRWQYGLNANAATENQHHNKNSISRSFGEGDDVIINFNNMSPEQYTKMMKSDFTEHNTEPSATSSVANDDKNMNVEQFGFVNEPYNEKSYSSTIKQNENIDFQDDHQHKYYDSTSLPNDYQNTISRNNIYSNTFSTPNTKNTDDSNYSTNDKIVFNNFNSYVTPIPLATQTYGYSDIPYESTKLKVQSQQTTESTNLYDDNFNKNDTNILTNNFDSTTQLRTDMKPFTKDATLNRGSNIKFTDFIQREEKTNFKPIVKINLESNVPQDTTTTELSAESIISENYFLKNVFNPDKNNLSRKPTKIEEPQKPIHNKINIEPKFDKIPKYIQYQSKPSNEIKNIITKPLDFTDVLNYITLKNHFESSKLKSKNKFTNPDKFNQRIERPQNFIPLENDRDEEEEQLEQQESHNNLRTSSNQNQQELRGIIKNYKVLQRNSMTKNLGQNKDLFMTDASQRHFKTIQSQNLPPLGRAGPSMKSYLPPTYL